MGFIADLTDGLAPHVDKLNSNLALHGTLIHGRLRGIQDAVDDLNRPDFGDKWIRFAINKKVPSKEPIQIGTVPMNEAWEFQAITLNGIQRTSPHFLLLANGIMVGSYVKEGIGTETIGGDQVLSPGEELTIENQEAEGIVQATLMFTRIQIPTVPRPTTGESGIDGLMPRNTHEPNRDIIPGREPGTYIENPSELKPEDLIPDRLIPSGQDPRIA